MTEKHEVLESFWRSAWERTPTPMQWAGQLSVDEGSLIQIQVGDRYEAHGIRRFGWKVAATNKAVQQQLGVSEPGFGSIYENKVLWSGAALASSQLIQPHIECELAFLLNKNIKSARTLEDMAESVDFVYPAFEYIEKRVTVLDMGVAFADNAEHTGIVLGQPVKHQIDRDYRQVVCTLFKNTSLIDSAPGEVVLGNPLNSILWLKQRLEKYQRQLTEGMVVMTGSFLRQLPVSSGDHIRAEFSGLGVVDVNVVN
ncbi:fumarylacetoacetate hydrolase family protein [Variovorax sp. J22G21]|uniref:2-keto-4-pentenoate hydratase n=1 Tax=Variovorax fucosicus TaxID=3053517 RepID=UPI002576407D|nr:MULTISPECIES: fumarylacetoacetate hydrolase family protein [unclassified Variovorax]MDM0042834.1 fumarylacetoacetate hydrolase family protein [Variovorax sp. J22R193]MDM0064903.1 fumarylacetoacetate hydrolase family protein [Variovorax sp. J22G21]